MDNIGAFKFNFGNFVAKPYFTLNLDVQNKPCLVIGGDGEALEKSERLLEAQAELLVVAKKAIPELVEFLKKNGARLELREVLPADITGKFFVLNCVKTEPALSKWIYEECLKQHAIISAYDQPEASNAVMQALVRAGQFRIAIGSGGASPGLASVMRKALEKVFDEKFVEFSEKVIAEREAMIAKGATPKERKAYFNELLKDFSIDAKITYPKLK
jgi:precorrin-2 dehydrogenase/sirohydrochlorin ferrochelatase